MIPPIAVITTGDAMANLTRWRRWKQPRRETMTAEERAEHVRKLDREKKRLRYHGDPDYRRKVIARNGARIKARYHSDPEFRAKMLANAKRQRASP